MSETKPKSGFSNIMGDKGSKRMLLFAGVVIVAGGGYAFFGTGGTNKAAEQSHLQPPPSLNANKTPGPDMSPNYQEAVRQDDKNRIDKARNNGESAMPTPLPSNTKPVLLLSSDSGDEEGRKGPPDRPVPRPVTAPPPPVPVQPTVSAQPPVQQVDQNIVAGMRTQMQQIAQRNVQPASTQFWYTPQTNGAASGNATANGNSSGAMSATRSVSSATQVASSQPKSRFVVPAAGTVLYSRLIGKVNSDSPGPILAEILQGPYAGARLLGTFQTGEEGVVMNFSSMTVPYTEDGQEKTEVVPIRAVAVDSANLGTQMATDVDHHILERVGIAAATSFLQGFGQAIAQSGSTTNINPYGGTTVTSPVLTTRNQLYIAGGAAAGATGQVFQQIYGSRKTTITVEADTPFGLLFLGSSN